MKSVKRLYKKETYKTRTDWLNNRGFGGSSASAILDCNPYMTKLELYKTIMFPKTKSVDVKNEATEYGVKCEPIIRKQFAIDFADKYKVIAPKGFEMYRRVDKKYLTATLDGILINKKTKEKLVLEIKTHDIRGKNDELSNWTYSIPQNYFIQVCHYLAVMNDFVGAVLVVKLRFFGENHTLIRTETRYYTISKNDSNVVKSIKALETAETNFWENNIVKKQVPSISINI